jgi:hypothetical protein
MDVEHMAVPYNWIESAEIFLSRLLIEMPRMTEVVLVTPRSLDMQMLS